MSRLDSFINRLQAQKVLLEAAAAVLDAAGEGLPGPVIELGLGNGRTYDHLREMLPGRRIIAFDRSVEANPRSIPVPDDLIIGEIETAGRAFGAKFGAIAALLHADLGNGVRADEIRLQRWLPDIVLELVRPGALVVTSTELTHPRLDARALPPDVAPGRYFIYRRH